MEEYIYPKKPFKETLNFHGKLIYNDGSIDDIHIIIQYSLLKGEAIEGKIIGTSKTFSELQKNFDSKIFDYELYAEIEGSYLKKVISKKVSITRLSDTYRSGKYKDEIRIIGDIQLNDITIVHEYQISESKKNSQSDERNIVYLLSGSRRIWQIFEREDYHSDGNVEIEVYKPDIVLDKELPFEIQIRPYYLYDKDDENLHGTLSVNVLSVIFKTNTTLENLSDDEFISLTKSIVQDLTTLASFISKSRITWYRYNLKTQTGAVSFNRRTVECKDGESYSLENPINLSQLKEFLKIGIKALRVLKEQEFDITMPILYFVSGHEAEFLREQFTSLFLSLESIKDMYAKREKLLTIFNDDNKAEFKKLKESIKSIVNENVKSDESKKKIIEKISELNRSSLKSILDHMFKKYSIDNSDLYPTGSNFKLIETRNTLFHTSVELDFKYLVKETFRLDVVLQRIILRLLNWPDISHTLDDYRKRWLSKDN